MLDQWDYFMGSSSVFFSELLRVQHFRSKHDDVVTVVQILVMSEEFHWKQDDVIFKNNVKQWKCVCVTMVQNYPHLVFDLRHKPKFNTSDLKI